MIILGRRAVSDLSWLQPVSQDVEEECSRMEKQVPGQGRTAGGPPGGQIARQ